MKKSVSVFEVEMMFETIGQVAIADEETNKILYNNHLYTIDEALKKLQRLQAAHKKAAKRRKQFTNRRNIKYAVEQDE